MKPITIKDFLTKYPRSIEVRNDPDLPMSRVDFEEIYEEAIELGHVEPRYVFISGELVTVAYVKGRKLYVTEELRDELLDMPLNGHE